MKKYLWLTKTLIAVSLLLTLGAVQVRAQEAGTESHIAFEVIAGKLKEGVDMTAQRVADKAVEALISKQKGFIYRETAFGQNGEWFAIVHWASLKDAENAAAVFMNSEQGKTDSSMLDKNNLLFKHYIKNE